MLSDMGWRNVHKSNNVAQTSISISLPQPTGSLPTSRNNWLVGVKSWTGSNKETCPCVCSSNTSSVNSNSLVKIYRFPGGFNRKLFLLQAFFCFFSFNGRDNLTKGHAKCYCEVVDLWNVRLRTSQYLSWGWLIGSQFSKVLPHTLF